MHRFGFPKRERLSSRKLWEEVFQEGTRLRSFPLLLFSLRAPLPENTEVQAGFSVPKRNFRKAVHRNRIKRLMKEAYRLEKPDAFNNMQGSYALVFLYLGKDMPDYGDISKAMRSVLTKFRQHEEAP